MSESLCWFSFFPNRGNHYRRIDHVERLEKPYCRLFAHPKFKLIVNLYSTWIHDNQLGQHGRWVGIRGRMRIAQMFEGENLYCVFFHIFSTYKFHNLFKSNLLFSHDVWSEISRANGDRGSFAFLVSCLKIIDYCFWSYCKILTAFAWLHTFSINVSDESRCTLTGCFLAFTCTHLKYTKFWLNKNN